MRTIDSWLSEYKESHQHPVNVALHKVAVPVILLTILGLAWAASMYLALAISLGLFIFYLRLSKTLAVGMFVFLALLLFVVYLTSTQVSAPLWLVSLLVFAVAWVFQFIGHAVEGRRPSFLKDLVFLLIGPAWVIVPIYRILKIKL